MGERRTEERVKSREKVFIFQLQTPIFKLNYTTMKKIYILIGLIGIITACEKDLDQVPISDPSVANFYRDTDDFEQAINGTYHTLGDYPAIHFYLSEIRSDNVYSPGTGVRDWNAVNNFENTLETNPLMAMAWDVSYQGIFRANTVLDKINEELVPDEATRNRIIGEAKFLRALFYFDLVRFFGKVPLYDHVVTPTEALEIPRSPVEEVYALIIADLEEAATLLPPSYTTKGRATSFAAKGILARVHLARSGPDYGIEGPGLGVNEYDKALALLNEVITSGNYGWVEDYTAIFSYGNENNLDIVFDVQAIDDGATDDRGIGTILPTLMYHESYGKLYTPFAGGVPGDSPIRPSEDLMDSYAPEDVRDDMAILKSFVDENENTINDPQFVKFLDLNNLPADRFNWGINFPILRFTDVLLMKAEALLQTGGSQTDIDKIVNDVRTRAGLGPVSDVNLDMLLEERRREFVAEGLRWHDLVRTGKALEVMNAWRLENDVPQVEQVEANDIIYPIHQTQLEVKDGLYEQNPGY